MKNIISALTTLLVLLSLGGCIGIKIKGTKGGNKYYETFYAGQNGMQYFIKPILYASTDKEHLFIDYSFRHTQSQKDSVCVHFSIFSKQLIKKIDSIDFLGSYRDQKITTMFVESKGKQYETRLTFNMPLQVFIKSMEDAHRDITIYHQAKTTIFQTTTRGRKRIIFVKRHVLDVM